jgi:hypothetical protein
MDMSQVQFAPTVSEDIRLAQKMLIGGDWGSAMSGRETCRETLEGCLETKTVVVSL